MTEPRKTPRTDAAELPWVANTQVACYGPCVKSDFASALEIETQELAEALRDMRDACKGEPAMNHQKYDALGIRVNNLLARAESATPAKFDFAAHDAAFVEWWSREGSGFHPAAIEDREEFTRRIANLAWIISANAARKQEGAR